MSSSPSGTATSSVSRATNASSRRDRSANSGSALTRDSSMAQILPGAKPRAKGGGSAGVVHVRGEAVGGGAQLAEVRRAADVQLVRGGFVRRRGAQVAALEDRVQEALVGRVAERLGRGALDQRADGGRALGGRRA